MKRHLNTLFITTSGAYLSKEGETVVVKVDNEVKMKIPIHTIGGIVCFGQVGFSPFLMGFCAENGVSISFLTETGRFLARVLGPVAGNVLLRREQYRKADDLNFSAELARSFVVGKLVNMRSVLNRFLRDHAGKHGAEDVKRASEHILSCLRRVDGAESLDVVRGIEGEGTRVYFSVFDHLITSQKEVFTFRERSRRPPMDRVNCLLSFLYTLLMHDVRSALESVGLDPAVGFLHRDRPGRYGLALDVMEEFRPYIVDRLVFSLINLSQIKGNGFEIMENGAVLMDEETRKDVIVAYQKRKLDELVHPFTKEKVTVGLLFHLQALLLARHIRGDIEAYPPFAWK